MPDPAITFGEDLLEEASIRWKHGCNKLLKLVSVLSCLGLVVLLSYAPRPRGLINGLNGRFEIRASDEQGMSTPRSRRLDGTDLDNSTLGAFAARTATAPRGVPTVRRHSREIRPMQPTYKRKEGGRVVSHRFPFLSQASSLRSSEGKIGVKPDMEVRWGPVLDTSLEDMEPQSGVLTMPIFPVSKAHMPYTSHTLFIFEPRYRAMYDDILLSGSRRFVVCLADEKTGRLSEVGDVFYLEDLKELSQITNDTLKYAGYHKIIGRVKILKVLNPRAALSGESYLRAEVADIMDIDVDEDTSKAEAIARKTFQEVLSLQSQLGEEPRFNDTVTSIFHYSRKFSRGTSSDDQGLWGTMRDWQAFLKQRALVRDQKMWSDFQHEAMLLLKSEGLDLAQMLDLDGENALSKLPAPVRKALEEMRIRYYQRVDQLDNNASNLVTQAMLQSESHVERLAIFLDVLGEERKRLVACKSLQSVFKKKTPVLVDSWCTQEWHW